jgi:hypothetical protein
MDGPRERFTGNSFSCADGLARMGRSNTGDDRGTAANRRRFLKGLGALSIVGLAGCGGDDGDTETPTDGTPTDTDADDTATDTGAGDTPTDTEADDTPTDTATATEGPSLGENPAQLLTLDGSPQAAPGSTVSVTGTVENPYLFTLRNGEITMDVPDGWEVTPVEGTSFDSLEQLSEQPAEWELTVPESASGTYDLTVSVTYAAGEDEADLTLTRSVLVKTPGTAPIGIDCGGSHTDERVTIDGLPFQPDAETSQSIEINCENRALTEEEIWWGENLTIDPIPNAYSDGCAFEEIDNTEHDTLYHTEHWAEDQLEYVFEIENGTYDVTLHFAEIGGDNERIFEVSMQGETVFETGGTLASLAGGTNTAYVETIEDVEVTGNQLTIEAVSSQENPKFSGIAIREA